MLRTAGAAPADGLQRIDNRVRTGITAVSRRHGYAVLVLLGGCWLGAAPGPAQAQTPSPLPEWVYSAGIPLRGYFNQNLPKWQVELGMGTSFQPEYEGASSYELVPAPSFDIRYSDIAFLSVGEGLGVNLLRGRNYRAGLAVTYNLGRKLSNDFRVTTRRRVSPTAEIKAFGEYLIFPVVLRLDFRQALAGGYDGYVGDFSVYMPVAGSRRRRFVVFAGPSVTFASGGYMRKFFDVNAEQAVASGLPEFDAHGGTKSVAFGVNATWFFYQRWFVNGAGAVSRLVRDAERSPFTQEKTQGTVNFTIGYLFGGSDPFGAGAAPSD